ncbi:MAG: 5-(carboxyamino)imidazole ribonucleotide synthase [Cryobacterium sp.]|nr:5-(carboxyamino)imidazole ribonucleotide synthase [Oligoflexia bacterium]
MKPLRVGILGEGQLGAMLAEAGTALGVQCSTLSPSRTYDPQAYDAVTYENESLDFQFIKNLSNSVPYFFPPVSALEIVRDRLTQKNFLASLGIPVAPYVNPALFPSIEDAFSFLGREAIVKLCVSGYDGKGQFRMKTKNDIRKIPEIFRREQSVMEAVVSFEKELSIISVRSRTGEIAHYPLTENIHRDGMLIASIARSKNEPSLKKQAEQIANQILSKLNYVGTFAIEFFEVRGKLIVNEVATRVHNSGHWTLDGSETSQFENHLRAGLGLPLGSTRVLRPTLMINLIGELPTDELFAEIPSARVYRYGKTPAPNRKLGHLNLPIDSGQSAEEMIVDVLSRLGRAPFQRVHSLDE